jgi:hypothetical protein
MAGNADWIHKNLHEDLLLIPLLEDCFLVIQWSGVVVVMAAVRE